MNARTSFISQIESTKSMEPCQRAFDDPTRASQSAAVRTAAFRQLAGYSASLQGFAMRLRVIRPIALHEAGLPQGRPGQPRRAACCRRAAATGSHRAGSPT